MTLSLVKVLLSLTLHVEGSLPTLICRRLYSDPVLCHDLLHDLTDRGLFTILGGKLGLSDREIICDDWRGFDSSLDARASIRTPGRLSRCSSSGRGGGESREIRLRVCISRDLDDTFGLNSCRFPKRGEWVRSSFEFVSLLKLQITFHQCQQISAHEEMLTWSSAAVSCMFRGLRVSKAQNL
jgi:hypothetical protein